jgi:hypothetical protein
LSRHETFPPDAEQQALALPELLDLLNARTGLGDSERQQAIACYLSGGEGSADAVKQLGGAFADGLRLRESKAD